MRTRRTEDVPVQRRTGDLRASLAGAAPVSTRTVLSPADPRPGAPLPRDDIHPQPLAAPHGRGWAVAALAVTGATAVGWRWAGRPPAVRTITMGPGGWVSFKGAKPPALDAPRPVWARLLRAQPVAAVRRRANDR
jgi:hypothetical protein